MDYLNVENTYALLLVVQALHLFHHRIVRRQISYVEGTAGLVLCLNPSWFAWPVVLMSAHLILVAIQIVGSIFIDKLSPQ